MTPNEQELINRAQAAEYLLMRLICHVMAREPDPVAAGNEFLRSIRDDLYFAVTARTKNPTKSDHLADEVSRAAEEIAAVAVKRLKIAGARQR
ncbi:MAG: hypothetical protein KIT16_05970 [Rhodospirillaceae bacterium]|nr:hypothetical protein [Rhodospirillaceae bacterium]